MGCHWGGRNGAKGLVVSSCRTNPGGNIEIGHDAGKGSRLGQGNVYGTQVVEELVWSVQVYSPGQTLEEYMGVLGME